MDDFILDAMIERRQAVRWFDPTTTAP